MTQHEDHRSHHSNWLRAAVLGANDGIVSTASLIIGIAAAGSSKHEILLAGVAGLDAVGTAQQILCGKPLQHHRRPLLE